MIVRKEEGKYIIEVDEGEVCDLKSKLFDNFWIRNWSWNLIKRLIDSSL
jgi:hypothetical protein